MHKVYFIIKKTRKTEDEINCCVRYNSLTDYSRFVRVSAKRSRVKECQLDRNIHDILGLDVELSVSLSSSSSLAYIVYIYEHIWRLYQNSSLPRHMTSSHETLTGLGVDAGTCIN